MLCELSRKAGCKAPRFLIFAEIKGLQHAEFLELRGAVARRLHEIEALAAGRLQFVDLLFILRERRRIDLDAGRLLEIGDDVARKLVRPVEKIEFAGRGARIAHDGRCSHERTAAPAPDFSRLRRVRLAASDDFPLSPLSYLDMWCSKKML